MIEIKAIYNQESEESVIGGLMIPNCDPNKKLEVFDLLTPEMFYLEYNRTIFEIQRILFKTEKPVDIITVANYAEAKNLNIEFHEIASRASNTPSAANILAYAENVRTSFYKRNLIALCQESTDKIFSGDDPEGVITELESNLTIISQLNGADHIEHINDISDAWLDELERRAECGGMITGQRTGIEDLDNLLLGLNEDDLIVVAGKPGTGKTLFAQFIESYITIQDKKPSLFFSMEMSREQVYERFVSIESKVNHLSLRGGVLNDFEFGMICEATGRLKNSGLHIVSRPAMTVGQIRGMARKFKARNPDLGFIVIDYLTKMSFPKADRRDISIGMVTSALKEMAQELKCPVMLLSQMNRGGDRSGQRPQMTDLKDSSSIEQDADVIIMLHKEGRLNEHYPQDLIEVIVRKARHTDEGTVFLRTGLGGYGQISIAEAAMEIERMGMNAPQQTKGKGGF